MRMLYCRNVTTAGKPCAHEHPSVAGDQPTQCPACDKPAFWTTEPVPKVAWTVNENDRRFLKSIRVTANNDHEDDAA